MVLVTVVVVHFKNKSRKQEAAILLNSNAT